MARCMVHHANIQGNASCPERFARLAQLVEVVASNATGSRFESEVGYQLWTGCHSGEGGGFLTRVTGWVRFPPGPPFCRIRIVAIQCTRNALTGVRSLYPAPE